MPQSDVQRKSFGKHIMDGVSVILWRIGIGCAVIVTIIVSVTLAVTLSPISQRELDYLLEAVPARFGDVQRVALGYQALNCAVAAYHVPAEISDRFGADRSRTSRWEYNPWRKTPVIESRDMSLEAQVYMLSSDCAKGMGERYQRMFRDSASSKDYYYAFSSVGTVMVIFDPEASLLLVGILRD